MINRLKLSVTVSGMLTLASIMCSGTAARAETKVTFGVGHMCCGKCQAAAKASLTKVSSAVSIEGTNVTVTLNNTDLVPVLDALRKGGFPANKIDAGSNSVTLGVAHLCCGSCKSGLASALKGSKVDALDMDAIAIGEDSVTIKAKSGQTLDLVPVLAAMEKGGFSAKSLTIASKTASIKPLHVKTVVAKATH